MIERNEVYSLYWYFAYERQQIFFKKWRGQEKPWSGDAILQTYKFCNAYRVCDRVSQYLLRNVIYNGTSYSDNDMIFRILLFKLFNKESTWELLVESLGDVTISQFSFEIYANLLGDAFKRGVILYNDAYISCANKVFGFERKYENHLALLEKMFFEDHFGERLVSCQTMKEAFELLRSYPLIGDFMAYQLITDINYSEVVNFSEDEFTVVGPGSIRGIKKCFKNIGEFSPNDVIKWMFEHQEEEFERFGLNFQKLGTRKLQLIDCQNLFCELDKYCRQAIPEITSNRTKIKKKYQAKSEPIQYIFPKKWNLTFTSDICLKNRNMI